MQKNSASDHARVMTDEIPTNEPWRTSPLKRQDRRPASNALLEVPHSFYPQTPPGRLRARGSLSGLPIDERL